jgi:hypothetical protein
MALSSNDDNTVNVFDRALGSLEGLPDASRTKPVTIQTVPPLGVGGVETFIVQTVRQKDIGDSIFITHVTGSTAHRMMIPPKVASVIARQRDQLTTRSRSKAAKAVAADRMAAGIRPFVKKKELA